MTATEHFGAKRLCSGAVDRRRKGAIRDKDLSDNLPERQKSREYATRMAFRSEAEMSIRRHNLRRLGWFLVGLVSGLVFFWVGFLVVFFGLVCVLLLRRSRHGPRRNNITAARAADDIDEGRERRTKRPKGTGRLIMHTPAGLCPHGF